jgi:NAD(P)H-nitrite reductase large subunit
MKDGWKVFAGGNGGGRARLAQEIARDLDDSQAMEMVDKIIEFYKANAKKHQRIGAMIDKMGFDEFKAAIVGE